MAVWSRPSAGAAGAVQPGSPFAERGKGVVEARGRSARPVLARGVCGGARGAGPAAGWIPPAALALLPGREEPGRGGGRAGLDAESRPRTTRARAVAVADPAGASRHRTDSRPSGGGGRELRFRGRL